MKLNYYEQFYFLIVSLYKEKGALLTSSDVIKYLNINNSIWGTQGDTLKDYRPTISGHMSDLREKNILQYDKKVGRSNLYYLNPELDVDNYLKEIASNICQTLDIDIHNVYDDNNAIFDYLDLQKIIMSHAQVCDLVNVYGRETIYGL
ncbi:hypothetical protein [Romboutsia lituseburensis]|uniref:hypothetical protein n=1 Tax=Romboutsia lituseburensis TaxID=1537 RepID=UPI00215ABD80|nr:hypothetical protein [Romboutsia lituseburensis]MCR8747260.1 hypothetical protein [Romboutsia lituseburensis]